MASHLGKWAWPNLYSPIKLNHWNDCYVHDFFIYFYYCGTVCNSKSLYFFVIFSKTIICEKMGNLFNQFNKTDTSLYLLTLEKVTVSLPTKCLSNPTSG